MADRNTNDGKKEHRRAMTERKGNNEQKEEWRKKRATTDRKSNDGQKEQ